MRILHTADWHLGRTLEGRSRLEEQEAFMDELVAIVKDQQIDLVLMAGDVYDTVNPPAQAEKLFYDSISRLADGGERQVVAIAGNHDNPERLAASTPLAGRQGITLLGLPDSEAISVDIRRTGERAILYALPYPSESRLKELLSDEADEESLQAAYSDRIGAMIRRATHRFSPATVNLIMSHLYVLGGSESDSERPIQVGGAYTVNANAFGSAADYVALGHLHRPQFVKAEVPVKYAGSPLAYSFSEAGQAKSVTILDIHPGGTGQMEEIFLTSGRPLVRWKAVQGIAQVYEWLEENRDAAAWIDLEIHLEESLSMEQIQNLRKQRSGIIQIRPIFASSVEQVTMEQERLPIDEMFCRFYAKQTGGARPEPELLQLFMELLHSSEEETAVDREGEEKR
ncbi:exonuclease SbcCD subunit D [Paenibacillus sp. J2TS4]|uniref:exonuclease SbcCD subunit D n=1 Tax=Paenibacillus sp. J2TS4 TaxID=2807194 RepID=UPI001B07821F|nr:exonuclease SbcCD subunit D [Paenibacillus sp. J2TS4]GIP35842.1 nuclease SbcCD subunit D [Paenibacillus sp. J2TS4]